MAKYCGNCGAQWPDDVRICGDCGTPFDDVEPIDEEALERQRKIKKILIIGIVAIAVLVLALVAWNIVTNFTGAKGAVRQVMNAYKEDNADNLVAMSSGVYFYSTETDYAEEYFENVLKNSIDHFENSVGYSYDLSYKIDDIHALSDRQLNNKLDDIALMYSGFDVGSIQEIQTAKVTLTAKQGKRHVDENLHVTISKEDGTWRLLEIY